SDLIPGEMDVRVMHQLVMVEIEHEQGSGAVAAAGALQFTLQEIQQRAAIPDSGQDFVRRLESQLLARADQTVLQSEDAAADGQTGSQFVALEGLGQIVVG